jgi:hypothetical protein
METRYGNAQAIPSHRQHHTLDDDPAQRRVNVRKSDVSSPKKTNKRSNRHLTLWHHLPNLQR